MAILLMRMTKPNRLRRGESYLIIIPQSQNWFKTFRFWLRARREEEKGRSVLLVREHFSTKSNAAIGQKMDVLNQF